MLSKNCITLRFKTDDFASLMALVLAADDHLVEDHPELLPHVAAISAMLGRNGYTYISTRTLARTATARRSHQNAR
jgi:hypothetical protein